MTISLDTLTSTRLDEPAIGLLFGSPGVGKTTLAAGAPDPVMIYAERGASQLDLPGWRVTSFDQIMQAMVALYGAEDRPFRTLIVDSLDAIEPLVIAEACARNNWSSVEAPGYGKGWLAVLDIWREYIEAIEALRSDRLMQIVQISHSEIRKFSSPISSDYDRFQLKLYGKAAALLMEAADWIGFYTFKITITKEDAGFGRTSTRASGGGSRVLFLEERPGFYAKNRFGMPPSLDIPTVKGAAQAPHEIWQKVAQYLPSVGP